MPEIWKTYILQVFCLHGGLSPSLDTLDNIRSLDRVQEVGNSTTLSGPAFFSQDSLECILRVCYRPFNPVTVLFWGLFTPLFILLNILMRSSPARSRKKKQYTAFTMN